MNHPYQSKYQAQRQLQHQVQHQLASRQARVAVYAATQSAADQRYLLQSFVAISATLLLWISLLH